MRKAQSKNISPIFIGGHRKSGTTVLLNLLDGHPGLCVYPMDINIMYAYYPLYEDRSDQVKMERLDKVVFQDMGKRPERIEECLDIDKYRKQFYKNMNGREYIIEEVIKQLLISYRQIYSMTNKESECDRIAAKETSIEIYSHEIYEWFPDAKFIHLIRDPRDNYSAIKSGVKRYYAKYGDDEKTLLHSLIERCKLGMSKAQINLKRFGEDRYKIVKFEDLVNNPQITLREIADFLLIEYQECMLIPTCMKRPTTGNSFEEIDFAKLSNVNIGRWRERISSIEARIIEFHFKDLMRTYDYPIEYDEYQQSDAASEFYKWANYNYHYSDRF